MFALTGREGKTFHPLAFTKSFAMIGVAILSITLVPALIPTFIKGRLRSEDESWLVRNLIGIYKPWLTWLMPRRNLAMWSFSALLIVGAGLFPLDAVLGIAWRTCFLVTVAVTMFFTMIFIVGAALAALCPSSRLGCLALAAYNFPKIGTDYMPAAGRREHSGHAGHGAAGVGHRGGRRPEGPRRPAADFSRGRDGRRQSGPGRHARPTPRRWKWSRRVITLRPKEHWPKRKLEYKDAERQTAVVLAALQSAV